MALRFVLRALAFTAFACSVVVAVMLFSTRSRYCTFLRHHFFCLVFGIVALCVLYLDLLLLYRQTSFACVSVSSETGFSHSCNCFLLESRAIPHPILKYILHGNFMANVLVCTSWVREWGPFFTFPTRLPPSLPSLFLAPQVGTPPFREQFRSKQGTALHTPATPLALCTIKQKAPKAYPAPSPAPSANGTQQQGSTTSASGGIR